MSPDADREIAILRMKIQMCELLSLMEARMRNAGYVPDMAQLRRVVEGITAAAPAAAGRYEYPSGNTSGALVPHVTPGVSAPSVIIPAVGSSAPLQERFQNAVPLHTSGDSGDSRQHLQNVSGVLPGLSTAGNCCGLKDEELPGLVLGHGDSFRK